jgi:hypothetical protein
MTEHPTSIRGIQSADNRDLKRPEILYKYFPPERVDVLEGMSLRFSRPSEFNDTFDTHYLVPNTQIPKAATARARLRNQIGIFCLTECPNDHLMWVHYAWNHTGFVLGFDTNASFFREKGRTLDKVKYEKGPRVFANASVEACFYKSDIWEHEQEWRCVRQFQTSEPREEEIDPIIIKKVILGAQMEAWQIARVALYAMGYDMMERTEFLLSTRSPKSWTFENKSKTISFCDNCSGNGYVMKDFSDKI